MPPLAFPGYERKDKKSSVEVVTRSKLEDLPVTTAKVVPLMDVSTPNAESPGYIVQAVKRKALSLWN